MASEPKAFPEDVIAMARRVASLADIYWAPECFPKEFEAAEGHWLTALTQFIASYSFERQGAPSIYRTYARTALENTGTGLAIPNAAFANAAWNEFCLIAGKKNHGTNRKVCALYLGSGTHQLSAIEFAMGLGTHNFNLYTWARDLLEKGAAARATNELLRIRGIGDKIAAFYLRDVARAANIDEKSAGPGWCFQPVDVWVERAARRWAALSGRVVTGYWSAAELIVELANAAGVVGGNLNGGAWILGSQFIDWNQDPDASRTLTSSSALDACLDDSMQRSRAIIEGITRSMSATTHP